MPTRTSHTIRILKCSSKVCPTYQDLGRAPVPRTKSDLRFGVFCFPIQCLQPGIADKTKEAVVHSWTKKSFAWKNVLKRKEGSTYVIEDEWNLDITRIFTGMRISSITFLNNC